MGGHLPHLDRAALRRLRETVKVLRSGSRRTLPLRQLVDLAAVAPVGPGITIDFEASQDLGDPLIVVRLPTHALPSADPRLATLSRREREVAELVAQGLTNKLIADRLCIATSTVKDHLHKTLQKTALPNRAALAAACRGVYDV